MMGSDLFSGWWVFSVYWIFASSYKHGSFMGLCYIFFYGLFGVLFLPSSLRCTWVTVFKHLIKPEFNCWRFISHEDWNFAMIFQHACFLVKLDSVVLFVVYFLVGRFKEETFVQRFCQLVSRGKSFPLISLHFLGSHSRIWMWFKLCGVKNGIFFLQLYS